ncbi:predicted protein [Sclerotinia sclerotiorum 1980 UF-70]|uniref:Uncharacterized protein n=1 Tax=Sclerotinia sclerotiorum (strain ATCC 18683 / 1980 / Ss-1) TaxID=665079 RepID=A7EKB9_SCLS1|nr:predicted protein [Sclerotinia sclerotiorum 1980 UF-70]EDO03285.1 predicted protein [Sclerotinia sclerotiorum 1980 UF-70]
MSHCSISYISKTVFSFLLDLTWAFMAYKVRNARMYIDGREIHTDTDKNSLQNQQITQLAKDTGLKWIQETEWKGEEIVSVHDRALCKDTGVWA